MGYASYFREAQNLKEPTAGVGLLRSIATSPAGGVPAAKRIPEASDDLSWNLRPSSGVMNPLPHPLKSAGGQLVF